MQTTTIKPSVQVEYPTLSDRVQSTFIDTLFIIVLMFIAASILEKYENAPDWIRIVLFFSFWGVYEPICTAFGFTIGNFVKGMRVRNASNPERKINIIQAIFRYLLKISLGWISFLTMHLNPQKRAIHDFVASSVMIKYNRS